LSFRQWEMRWLHPSINHAASHVHVSLWTHVCPLVLNINVTVSRVIFFLGIFKSGKLKSEFLGTLCCVVIRSARVRRRTSNLEVAEVLDGARQDGRLTDHDRHVDYRNVERRLKTELCTHTRTQIYRIVSYRIV